MTGHTAALAVAGVDLVICDIDGVVLLGDQAIPGATEALERLREHGVDIVFCTNNSARTPEEFSELISSGGFRCDPEDVVTSGAAAARVLAARLPAQTEVLVIGGTGLTDAVGREGLTPVGPDAVGWDDQHSPDALVVGLDREVDYHRIHVAATVARRGVPFIATNNDALVPGPDGYWPANGAILAAIEKAAGRRAEVVGKPHAPIYDIALAGRAHDRALVVGDNADTDLAGGRELGLTTVLVRTDLDSELRGERGVLADLTVSGLAELVETVIQKAGSP